MLVMIYPKKMAINNDKIKSLLAVVSNYPYDKVVSENISDKSLFGLTLITSTPRWSDLRGILSNPLLVSHSLIGPEFFSSTIISDSLDMVFKNDD